MVILWCLPPLFFFVSSGCEGVMDFVNWYGDRIPWKRDYWDPRVSYVNKYVDGDVNKGRRKWFWGLVNMPVAFTDGWHFMKWLRNRSHELAQVSFVLLFIWAAFQSVEDVIPAYISLGACIVMKLFGFFCVYNLLKLKHKIN